MEAWRDGSVGAFDLLFERYQGMLYRYLLRQSGQTAAAEELFQEVWAALIKHRLSYTVKAKFRTYLFHIAHSKLIDHYRQSDKHSVLSYEDDDLNLQQISEAVEQPEHQADIRTKLERLLVLLAQLPAAQREIFLLHEEAGMGLTEIAEAMNVSRDTVKSRLRYALEKLRKGMRAYL